MPRSSRSRLNLSNEEKKKRRREQKKISMRRARAKLDAIAIEERRRKDRERYARKKQDGLVKTIKDFTPREQRQIRKIWREKSRVRREKAKIRRRTEEILLNDTPPSSPCSSFSRIQVGRSVSAKNRRKLKAKNEYLSRRLQLLENKLAKYRMRLLRLKRKKHQINDDKVNIKEAIQNFLLDDENSRLTAGRKQTITRRKVKKQIRLLNDTLLNLYKTFIHQSGLSISYETFRRHRPFWVIFPKTSSRDTCLCAIHSNSDYMVEALVQARILPRYSSATEVAKSLCCNNMLNVPCLERTCQECSTKTPNFNITHGNDTIIYERWVTKNVETTVRGHQKQFKKTLREKVKTTQKNLIDIFSSNLPKFMQHLSNILNQFRVIRAIKKNITPSEGLLHIDFSENYTYKYAAEIQAVHFGGSKGQLSLHTCVYYSTDFEPPENTIKTTSICTISQNLRHDPVLICAHLKPVVDRIKELSPALKVLHILSDGPSSQYRNKTMFQMIVNYISKISNAESIVWHFSEAGHGKGAPDGADKAVAHGRDITNIDSFVDCLKEKCKGVEIIPIDDVNVQNLEEIAAAISVRPFKGTLKIHQITWNAIKPNILYARRLSCVVCAPHTKCSHFGIGEIPVQIINLPGTSRASVTSPTLVNSVSCPPSAHLESPLIDDESSIAGPSSLNCSPSRELRSPSDASSAHISRRTASASTITGPRTPEHVLRTPSPDSFSNARQPLTPRKTENYPSVYSDSDSSSSSGIFMYKRPVVLGTNGDKRGASKRGANRHLEVLNDSDQNSRPKKAKRSLNVFVDSDDERPPANIMKRRPAADLHSDKEESRSTNKRPEALDDSSDKNSPLKRAYKRPYVFVDSDDEHPTLNTMNRRPTLHFDTDEENKRPTNRRSAVLDDSSDQNSSPKKANKRPDVCAHRDDEHSPPNSDEEISPTKNVKTLPSNNCDSDYENIF